jgi:hypothetical protein|tara:strand:+ start:226 stop:492 length:267 start_codon:yes stop_codon:yes gene_type:complete
MDKLKHTEYEIQQLNDYGYIKYPFKKENNNKKNLRRLWRNKKITYTQYFFRSKVKELNIDTWECWECNAKNTHNIDDFGFCKECLQSQ